MGGSAWTIWPWLIAGGVVGVMGLVLLAWALLSDRSGGRRRCPKCWYDMAGTEALTCSECGKTVKRERQLFKTRRRWNWTLVGGLALLGAAVLVVTPKVRRDGPWSLVGDRALLAMLPLAGDGDGWIADEVQRRTTRLELSSDDLQRLFNRCAAGDRLNRPLGDGWREKYGRLIDRLGVLYAQPMYADLLITDGGERVDAALLDLPMHIEPAVREQWPEDVPVAIEVRMSNWWPDWGARVYVTPETVDGTTQQLWGRRDVITLPPLPAGVYSLSFSYRTETPEQVRPGKPPQTGELTVRVRVEGTMDDALPPARAPKLDTLMATVAQRELKGWRNTSRASPSAALIYVAMGSTVPEFNDIGFGVVVEYVRNGEVVGTERCWWLGGPPPKGYRSPLVERDWKEGDSRAVHGKVQGGDTWSIRLRSDQELALRVPEAKRYWKGGMEFQLTSESP